MKKIFFYLIVMLAILVCNKSYSQKIDSSIIELTNKLGVTATIIIANDYHSESYISTTPNTRLGKTFPEQICGNFFNGFISSFKFVIKLRDNAYILLPLGSFKEAILKDSNHIITLKNGTTIVGKFIGQIETNGKVYDMPSVNSIKLIKLGASDKLKKITANKTWQLSTTLPNLSGSVIAEPKFAFGYSAQYKSGGMYYTWETETRINTTESFIIKVGAEEISANLSDFAKVILSNEKTPPANIEITSQSGVTTSGSLILKYDDKNDIGWALFARLPEMDNATLVLIMPNISFTEIKGIK